MSFKQLTFKDVLNKYGHFYVKPVSFYRLIFTYSATFVTSADEPVIEITLGDGTPEALYNLELKGDLGSTVLIKDLLTDHFDLVHSFEVQDSNGVLLELYEKEE